MGTQEILRSTTESTIAKRLKRDQELAEVTEKLLEDKKLWVIYSCPNQKEYLVILFPHPPGEKKKVLVVVKGCDREKGGKPQEEMCLRIDLTQEEGKPCTYSLDPKRNPDPFVNHAKRTRKALELLRKGVSVNDLLSGSWSSEDLTRKAEDWEISPLLPFLHGDIAKKLPSSESEDKKRTLEKAVGCLRALRFWRPLLAKLLTLRVVRDLKKEGLEKENLATDLRWQLLKSTYEEEFPARFPELLRRLPLSELREGESRTSKELFRKRRNLEERVEIISGVVVPATLAYLSLIGYGIWSKDRVCYGGGIIGTGVCFPILFYYFTHGLPELIRKVRKLEDNLEAYRNALIRE